MDIEDIIVHLLSAQDISFEEQQFFDQWMLEETNRKKFFELKRIHSAVYVLGRSAEINTEKAWNKFMAGKSHSRFISSWLRYAALIVLFVGVGIAFTFLKNKSEIPGVITDVTDVLPGQKQAVLTLSNGRRVVLSDSTLRMTEENGTIIQVQGNQLLYQKTDSNFRLVYNTIRVPRGGEYRLQLSDGSILWINSESEITYPVVFGREQRAICLKGEAFFEVKKDSLRPFLVHTDQFDVRVTGTRFNVRTYPEDIASATLALGGIQLEKNNIVTRLAAGQQASLINGLLQVKEIDLQETIAWHYDAFCFKQRKLESVMNEISRWYDLEIFYQNDRIRDYHFTAWFRRNIPVSELISILEKTGEIKFELKGKTLTVKAN